MYDPNILSIIPSLIAIVLAIVTRQVVISLGIGIWIGNCLLFEANPLSGLSLGIESIISVFESASDTKVIIFTLIIGGLIATIERLGGVRGFISLLENKEWVDSPGKAKWLAYSTGIVVFIESNITLLVAGSISRPLFDRYKIAREKLAYIIDSTAAPICIMIPLNAWGALVIGLIAANGIEEPLQVFIHAIPFNLYPIIVILFSAMVIFFDIEIGPMRSAQQRTTQKNFGESQFQQVADDPLTKKEGDKARYMLFPIAVMVLSMPICLYVTGEGDIMRGSGSTSVLWAVLLALLASWILGLHSRKISIDQLMQVFLKGAGEFLPIAVILLFALALGDMANLLGTGAYVASLAQEALPLSLMLPLLFVTSSVIAFSIGSSWGTFAIMIPLSIQISLSLGVSPALFLASVLSGAVFGDHASPISDTTVVASMASGTDHIEHVKTQLPYALLSAAIATVGFYLLGIFSF